MKTIDNTEIISALEDLVFHVSNNGIPYSLLKEKIIKARKALKNAETNTSPILSACKEAIVAFQLLGSGQEPPLSNSEYVTLLSDAIEGRA